MIFGLGIVSTSEPEIRAECGISACSDLWGAGGNPGPYRDRLRGKSGGYRGIAEEHSVNARLDDPYLWKGSIHSKCRKGHNRAIPALLDGDQQSLNRFHIDAEDTLPSNGRG